MHKHNLGVLPVIDGKRVQGTISYKELYNTKPEQDELIGPFLPRKNHHSFHHDLYVTCGRAGDQGRYFIAMDKEEDCGLGHGERMLYSSMDKQVDLKMCECMIVKAVKLSIFTLIKALTTLCCF